MAATAMADDDLRPGSGVRRLARLLAFAWFVLIAGLLATAGGVALLGDPRAGEPVLTLDIKSPVPKPAQKKQGDVNLIGTGPQPTEPSQSGMPPDLIPDQITQTVRAGDALIADPALIENTSQGPLPRIADDGRRPLQAYAPAFNTGGRTPIAIVVSGLGISAKATAAAIIALPPGVTLSFAPYAGDVQRWVGEARKRGHEVLLEVPMEPFDFPDSDPGAHTLRATASEDANIERLTWSMTRFTGYAGVTNLLGGRFMANADALQPVMTFLSRRGLVFFDSGTASHSAAPDLARQLEAPFVESTATIDTIQTALEIDHRLSELENQARSQGGAAASGFLYPVTIERIARWAPGLPGRGFVLVPVSAIIAKPSQPAP